MITDICNEFWEEFFNDVKKNNVPTDTYKVFKGVVIDYLCEKLKEGYPVREVSVWIAVPIDEFKEKLEKINLPSLKYWKLYEGGLTPKWLYKEGYIIERWNYSAGGIANVFNTSLTDFIETLNRIHLDCKEHYFMGFAESSNLIGQVYEYFFECNPNLFDEMFRTLQPIRLKDEHCIKDGNYSIRFEVKTLFADRPPEYEPVVVPLNEKLDGLLPKADAEDDRGKFLDSAETYLKENGYIPNDGNTTVVRYQLTDSKVETICDGGLDSKYNISELDAQKYAFPTTGNSEMKLVK